MIMIMIISTIILIITIIILTIIISINCQAPPLGGWSGIALPACFASCLSLRHWGLHSHIFWGFVAFGFGGVYTLRFDRGPEPNSGPPRMCRMTPQTGDKTGLSVLATPAHKELQGDPKNGDKTGLSVLTTTLARHTGEHLRRGTVAATTMNRIPENWIRDPTMMALCICIAPSIAWEKQRI